MELSSGARVAAAAVLALLAWRVVYVNAVVYEDRNRPAARVPAGVALAEAAAAAIRANPADARALLALGQERERSGDPAGAARAYADALALAPVDRVALHEAAASDLRHGRVGAALPRLDALATHYLPERPAVFTVLGQMLAVPEHRALVEARASGAPWTAAFVDYACAHVDPVPLAALFMRHAAAGRASADEVRCMTDRLRRAGRWDLAYHAWLNALPRARLAQVGHVFNGGFEHVASGVGFDWRVEQSAAHSVEFAPAAGASGARALQVAYTGKRLAGPALTQHLALLPGRYELTGRARLQGLQSVRGIHWVLRCGDEPTGPALARTERFLGTEAWRAFVASVAIPPGCPGQVLSLEPVGLGEGTVFASGTAWFDDLRLVRAR